MVGARDSRSAQAGRREFNVGSPKQLGEILFDELKLPGGKQAARRGLGTDAEVLDDLPRKAIRCRQDPGLAPARQAEGHLYRRAGATRSIPRPAACTPPITWRSPPPGGWPRPTPICRTFRCAPRKAARSARPSSPKGPQTAVGRLFADRAAPAGPCRRASTPLKQPSRGDDIHAITASRGVRRAGRGHATRWCAAAPRRSISASSTASRAFGLANQLGISSGEARGYIDKYFERYPGHPRLHGKHQGTRRASKAM